MADAKSGRDLIDEMVDKAIAENPEFRAFYEEAVSNGNFKADEFKKILSENYKKASDKGEVDIENLVHTSYDEYSLTIAPHGMRVGVTKTDNGYILEDEYAGMTESQIATAQHLPSDAYKEYKRNCLQDYADRYDAFNVLVSGNSSEMQANAYRQIVYMTKMQDPVYLNYLSATGELQSAMEEYDAFMSEHTQVANGVYGMTDSDFESVIAERPSLEPLLKEDMHLGYQRAQQDANYVFSDDYIPISGTHAGAETGAEAGTNANSTNETPAADNTSSEKTAGVSPFDKLRGGAGAFFANLKNVISKNPVGAWFIEKCTEFKNFVKEKVVAMRERIQAQTESQHDSRVQQASAELGTTETQPTTEASAEVSNS